MCMPAKTCLNNKARQDSNKESVEQTTRVASPYCDTEKGIRKQALLAGSGCGQTSNWGLAALALSHNLSVKRHSEVRKKCLYKVGNQAEEESPKM